MSQRMQQGGGIRIPVSPRLDTVEFRLHELTLRIKQLQMADRAVLELALRDIVTGAGMADRVGAFPERTRIALKRVQSVGDLLKALQNGLFINGGGLVIRGNSPALLGLQFAASKTGCMRLAPMLQTLRLLSMSAACVS